MLAELLKSRVRAKALAWFFSHPSERFYVRQLGPLLRCDATHTGRELLRLEALGILVSQIEGREKYYQVNARCPIFSELRSLVMKTAGLADILRSSLKPLKKGISTAFVYGSQATGKATARSDVDLLVIGDADEIALHKAVSKAEREIGRAVNYRLLSLREFRERRRERHGFLSRVLAGEKLFIIGTPDEL